jgi:hypothetical protein
MTMVEETAPPIGEAPNEALILEMLRMDDPAPEPGTMSRNDIIHRGDEEVPAPIVAGALTSAGYVYVYHTQTHERSPVNINMLPAQMRKRIPKGEPGEGKLAFTLQKPSTPPFRGSLKCLLHVDRREPEFDKMGFSICRKSNIPTEFDLRGHMEHRHSRVWKSLEERRVQRERAETLDVQRAMLAIAGRGQPVQPVTQPVVSNPVQRLKGWTEEKRREVGERNRARAAARKSSQEA